MKHFKGIVMAAFAVVIAGVYSLSPALVSANSSASLSINPKKTYTIEPGRSIDDTLVVRNLDRELELDLTMRIVDFTYIDDGGSPRLMLDEDAPQTTWSLKPFLTVPETVTIPPQESQTLDINVSIPENHGAGSYYSAIVYSTSAPDGGNVGLNASGVTLVFASVPGDVEEDLTLVDFGAYRSVESSRGEGYTKFTMDEPERIAFTLANKGNVVESPVGSITLRDMFGRERLITEVNPNGSLALIGQTRTFISCIELSSQEINLEGNTAEAATCTSPGLWPGFYRASIELFYGQNGNLTREIVGETWFIYAPAWFLILLIILIGAVVYIAWRIVEKVRSRRPSSRKRFNRRK